MALAEYKLLDASFKYVVLGTHQRQFQELSFYWEVLQDLTDRLDLKDNVIWVDYYLSRAELLKYVLAADVGLVTYTRADENATGITPLFLGCGRVVIATAFEGARALQRDVNDLLLAPINDPGGICKAIETIADNSSLRRRIMEANYSSTRNWLWDATAEHYRTLLEDVL